MWSIITGGITTLVGKWFDNKAAESDQKHTQTMTKIKGSDDYDINAQQNMKTSWKDEYLILVHTFLIWGYGIPSEQLHQALDNVWLKMSTAPTEWWVIYAGMVISTFGLRFMSQKVLGSRGKQ